MSSCKAYYEPRFDEATQTAMETLYAVLEDDTVLKCDERPFSHDFIQSGDVWRAIPSLPDDPNRIGFIGNYPAPKVTP